MKHAPVLTFISVVFSLGMVSCAQAATITVQEEAIQSLANAPEVLGLSGGSDRSGRPVLLADLKFMNECYADSGARLLTGRIPAGPRHAVVLQRVDPRGCPDFYQPTKRRVALLLPEGAAKETMRVIGKPAPEGIVRPINLESVEKVPPRRLPAVKFQHFGPGTGLPAYELTGLSGNKSKGGGYTLTGRATLANGCSADMVRVHMYEVPDNEGMPRYDVVVLTAPERCAKGGRQVTVNVNILTPQRPRGRSVYILNEAEPTARPIG